MSWTRPALLALLAVLVALTLSNGAQLSSSAVSDDKTDYKAAGPQGAMKRIFMPETDAFNFFRRRSRRAVKSQDELNAEQRQRLAADERMKEYHENQRSKYENYAEEEGDEQDERSREGGEQYREFHYDGIDQS
ncbi:unique cartilage matrix-associated protein [Alosa alosa]|nr:unique cartilage matrix-associated protein [Alosa sapidissima]XP_048113549.1 unique cartilage matrix-associated protein [Alosa alosa]